jgi:SAM-dependent methyltransferase
VDFGDRGDLAAAGDGKAARLPTEMSSLFDSAADHYDAARPSYPSSVFDELERRTGLLHGLLVLDFGAGTGIASRQLASRGAVVVSLDIGERMLRRARVRSPQIPCVLADGHRMPVRDAAADMLTFAQAWHWFDIPRATAEVARVLKPGGYWAAWWNRASAAGERWFDRYEDLLERECPGYTWRRQLDADLEPNWTGALARAHGRIEPAGTVVLPWLRHVSATDWLTDERSKSYVIALEPAVRAAVLAEVENIIAAEFPDGQLTVRYQTTLILARKAS